MDDPGIGLTKDKVPYHLSTIISTGSLGLDIALGIGGVPLGSIVEISASEISGKTTLAYHLIAETQKLGGLCAFIDSDRSFEPGYARNCGVQVESLYYSQPEHSEQAFDMIETLSNSSSFALVVVDSLTSLVTHQELADPLITSTSHSDNESFDAQTELLARSLRKLSGVLRRTEVTVLFTNQADRQLSTIYHQLAGHPARLALKLSASIRLRLSPLTQLLIIDQVCGIRIRARVIKNKFAPCLQPADFDIIHNQGIDQIGEMLELGVQYKLVQQKNTGIYYQSERLGKISSEVRSFLNQNIQIRNDLEMALRQLLIPDI
jgi:recombination protein RecA